MKKMLLIVISLLLFSSCEKEQCWTVTKIYRVTTYYMKSGNIISQESKDIKETMCGMTKSEIEKYCEDFRNNSTTVYENDGKIEVSTYLVTIYYDSNNTE